MNYIERDRDEDIPTSIPSLPANIDTYMMKAAIQFRVMQLIDLFSNIGNANAAF